MVSRVIPVEDFDLVIFGGTGDLARRKILPGLYRRFCSGQMPDNARVIGAARSELDSAGYRDFVREADRSWIAPSLAVRSTSATVAGSRLRPVSASPASIAARTRLTAERIRERCVRFRVRRLRLCRCSLRALLWLAMSRGF